MVMLASVHPKIQGKTGKLQMGVREVQLYFILFYTISSAVESIVSSRYLVVNRHGT